MLKKLFELKFLHLLPEFSGQIDPAVFPESPVEPEVCPLKPSDNNFKTASSARNLNTIFLPITRKLLISNGFSMLLM